MSPKVTRVESSTTGENLGLCVMLLTYDRFAYAQRTLNSALTRIRYTRGPVYLHVASDGDSDQYINDLIDSPARVGWTGPVTVSNSHRRGYGANYNEATQMVHSLPNIKYVLPLEDDWECIRPLDLDHFSRALDGSPTIGCIRMGYIGFTQPLRGTLIYKEEAMWLGLHESSEEPHVFAGHPRLETVDWQRYVGPWIEGIGAGATEFEVTHREEARKGVVWPMEIDPRPGYGMFAHIGTNRAEDVA